jgi:hypothetical protein
MNLTFEITYLYFNTDKIARIIVVKMVAIARNRARLKTIIVIKGWGPFS